MLLKWERMDTGVLTTTFAPSRASLIAVARPIPLDPPVMRATFPSRGLIEDIVGVQLYLSFEL